MSQEPDSSQSQTQSQPQTQSQSGSSSSSGPASASQSSSSSGTLSSVDTAPVRDLASIPEEPETQPWGRLLPLERGFKLHSEWTPGRGQLKMHATTHEFNHGVEMYHELESQEQACQLIRVLRTRHSTRVRGYLFQLHLYEASVKMYLSLEQV